MRRSFSGSLESESSIATTTVVAVVALGREGAPRHGARRLAAAREVRGSCTGSSPSCALSKASSVAASDAARFDMFSVTTASASSSADPVTGGTPSRRVARLGIVPTSTK
jgi:hypothetical protein